MLKGLTQDLKSADPAAWKRACLRAFHGVLLALCLPGLPLGGLYWLSKPAPYPLWAALGLAGLGLLLGLGALQLAGRSARDPRLNKQQAGLTSAMQLASAPAVPFLLGCAALHQPLAWGLLWVGAALLYAAARGRVGKSIS